MPRRRRVKWGPGNPLWEWQRKRKTKGKPYIKAQAAYSEKLYKRQRYGNRSGVRHMARRRSYRRYFPRRRHRRGSFKIPLAPVAGALYGLTNGVGGSSVIQDAKDGLWENSMKQFAVGLTGFNPFDGKFDLGNAKILHGLLVGIIIHKVCSAFGVNRAIRKIPLVNI